MTPRFLRRMPAALALAVGSVVIAAPPASAHTLGGVQPTNYRSTILTVVPPAPGVTVRLLDLGRRVELTNTTSEDVTVLGYLGEPYLRVGPAGVFENLRSPARYLNRVVPAGTQPAVPKIADPNAPPDWHRTAGGTVVRWRDHRTRWEGKTPAAVARGPHQQHVVANWSLHFTRGPTTIDTVVLGHIVWTPPPSVVPWWALAAGLAVLTAAIGLRHRWGPPLAAATVALVLVDIVHSVGLAAFGRTSLALTLGRVALGGLFSVAIWVVGFTTAPALARNKGGGLVGAGVVGVGVALLGGIGDLSSLGRSQLPFAFAPVLARVAIASSMGLGVGVLVAVVLIERRSDY